MLSFLILWFQTDCIMKYNIGDDRKERKEAFPLSHREISRMIIRKSPAIL
jgi:hypothetical protein